MGFKDVNEGAAAVTFLVLYVLLIPFAFYAVSQKGLKSPFTTVAFFVLIRIGAQLSGVGFAVVGYENLNWLIAYLILGAEGYFMLILTCMYFYCHSELIKYGRSFFRPTIAQCQQMARESGRSPRFYKMTSWAGIFHWLLIPSNALVIAGGSMLAGVNFNAPDAASKVHTAKVLRGVGQAMFVLLNLVSGLLAIYLIKYKKIRTYMMYALLAAWPFLFIRGIFGLLSVFISDINYFDLHNYTANGISPRFIACEYVLATSMEYIAACLILSTYYIKNPYKKSLDHYNLIATDTVELTGDKQKPTTSSGISDV
ncbi:hypothetical protein TRVA0_023S00364 [Trichomonascus vanleenenianus]|uniref:uncharacterized protein n=1 Tax=Trichomonascus vanleenenianus TaxID=2268995 RepID=UPI003EC9B7D1